MKKKFLFTVLAILGTVLAGCKSESKEKDRSDADKMFARICKLTKEYTEKLSEAPDSATWAEVYNEFEDKLEKISFSYPPDTDLLLTEGQNDTIQNLLEEIVKVKKEKIHDILHPFVECDSLLNEDSIVMQEANSEIRQAGDKVTQADASRSLGN